MGSVYETSFMILLFYSALSTTDISFYEISVHCFTNYQIFGEDEVGTLIFRLFLYLQMFMKFNVSKCIPFISLPTTTNRKLINCNCRDGGISLSA